MARLPEITAKEGVSADKQHIFDAIAESRGRVGGPFAMLMHSPDVAERIAHLGTYIRFESTLPPATRELAIITTSREFDCDYEWSAHSRLAAEAGVPDETIEAVANRADSASLTDDEALVVRYGRELLGQRRVSGDTFDAARGRFGDRGVLELTATVGYYAMMACVLNAFQMQPPPGAPRLP